MFQAQPHVGIVMKDVQDILRAIFAAQTEQHPVFPLSQGKFLQHDPPGTDAHLWILATDSVPKGPVAIED